MSWQAGCRCAQHARRGRIGEADQSVAIQAADAVGHRVEQNLLLAVELFRPAPFVRAGQHLPQRSGHSFDRCHGLAILAQAEMAIEFQNRKHPVSNAHRHRAAGDHSPFAGRVGVWMKRFRSNIGNPDRPAVLPGAANHPASRGQRNSSAVLDQRFSLSPRRTPARAEFQAVFFGVHFPFQGHVPTLGDAQSLKDAHPRHFRRGIFTHDFADDPLQGHAPLALHKQAKHQHGGRGSGKKNQHFVEARVEGEVVPEHADN
jgi:hypothetical protein